tara:strand:+ start:22648 stop:24090 length:1443 start_codon:yes stop_codon:yes gene_type:complete
MVFQNNVLAGGAGGSGTTGYTIGQSIRFNSDDSAYMHRTPSSSGNRKTFTSSCWVKLGDALDSSFSCALPMPTVAQTASYGMYLSGNDIQIFIYYTGSAWQGQLYTNRKFRDPSAWFHFVLVVDTTQAVPTERVRFYINGTRETDWQIENYPNQNQDTDWNNSGEKMGIGVNANGFGGSFGEYYAAEMVYIDGTAYGPENFGETNSSGIWVPKDVSGLSFGTNGFYIDGRDSSDLGDDESGQGNDFTVVNLASHDQVSDSPSNNFAVMNPLDNYYFGSTFSEGNLQVTTPNSAVYTFNTSSILVSSGKWYVEFEVHHYDSNLIGVAGQASGGTTHVLGTKNDQVGYYAPDGSYYKNNSQTSYGNSYGAGDIIGVALDLDNSKLYFSKNGTFQNSGVPTSGATGTGAISIPAPSATVDGGYRFACGEFSNNYASHNINFGQDGTFNGNVTAGGNSDGNGHGNFKYSVPSGYLALCTKNLGS